MKIKEGYEEKMRRAQRENHNSLPYELVQVCKAKERQLAKQLTRKRTNTLK